MRKDNLLASAALFSELFNSNHYQSVGGIIAEFIKAAVIHNKKWRCSSIEVVQLLQDNFDFSIPESVVRTVLRTNLKKFFKHSAPDYVVDPNTVNSAISLEEHVKESGEYDQIINSLIGYIESIEKDISEKDKEGIRKSFNEFLVDDKTSDRYSTHISAFIIKNETDAAFTARLNRIKEGIILYNGIRHTVDLDTLGKWTEELQIFLNTEQLFNAQGYNGELQEKIFLDFFNLVSEVNTTNKNKQGKKKITLRYFRESRDEIDGFFYVAEKIIGREAELNYSRPAMVAILQGCKERSDILLKKQRFYQVLDRMGIVLEDSQSGFLARPELNVEDQGVINAIAQQSKDQGKDFDKEECERLLHIFSKINYLRGGDKVTRFEKCRCVLMSDNRFALYLGHHNKVKFGERDVSFCKDSDYIISQLWFKLKKGFGSRQDSPRSFNVVAKAQIVLSSQLNREVYKQYVAFQDQFRSGNLTEVELTNLIYDLRENQHLPEHVTKDTIDTSLLFLSNPSMLEDVKRERDAKEAELIHAKEKIQQLQIVIKQKEAAEQAEAEREAYEQQQIKRMNYLETAWQKHHADSIDDMKYFLRISGVTLVVVALAVLPKLASDLPLFQVHKYALALYYLALVALAAVELVTRSYLNNKEKVRNGYLFLRLQLSKSSFEHHKESVLSELGSKWDSNAVAQGA